jgi:TP901 family phage tail tape measure protein
MATLRRLNIVLAIQSKGFSKAIKGVEKDLDKLSRSLKSSGETITRYLTIPLLAAGTAVTKMSVDFDSSLDKIVGLVGVARSEVDVWRRQLLDLAPALGKSPKELADAMFFVTSAGNRGTQAMDVLIATAKAARAGLGETEIVADAVTSAINAYGKENLSAGKATGILVAAVREGKAEASSIAPVLGAVLPIAQNLGVGFDQVAASIASFTRIGLDASLAGTALRALLNQIKAPGEDAKKTLASVNLSAQQLRNSLREDGLIGTLTLLQESFKGNEEAMSRIFPNIRALTGVMALTGGNAKETQKIFKALSETTEADLDKAFKVAAEGNLTKLSSALANVQAAMIRFGDAIAPVVIPIIQKIGEFINRLSKRFENLTPRIKRAIVIVAGMAAALGPLILALGAVAGAIATVLGSIASLSAPGAIAGVFTSTLPVIAAVAAAIVSIGTALAAVVGIVRANWGQITAIVSKVYDDIRPVLQQMGIVAKDVWIDARNEIVATLKNLSVTVGGILTFIAQVWADHGKKITAIVVFVWNTIVEKIRNSIKIISTLVNALLPYIASTVGQLQNISNVIAKIFGSDTKIQATSEALKQVNTEVQKLPSGIEQVKAFMDKLPTTMKEFSSGWVEAENGVKRTNEQVNNLNNNTIDAAKELRNMYGVITKGDAEASMQKLLDDFTKLAQQGVNSQQLLSAFAPKLKEMRDAAKGYTDLKLPARFDEFSTVLESKSIFMVDSFAKSLGKGLPDASNKAQAAIATVGEKVSEAVVSATDRAIQAINAVVSRVQQLDGTTITINIDADTDELKRKIAEIGLSADTSGVY